MAGVNLEQLAAQPVESANFRLWEKVALALEQKRMPPEKMPQPADGERRQTVAWIRSGLASFAKLHDGEPGRVTVRRLTSGEYAYALRDLTGVDVDTGIDATTDSVGGEGFTNFGDVQFMQDSNVERFLTAAKRVSNHAVIGSGPLAFFSDPGKTGFELSAIARIRDIYATHGFRTVSGEGGRPFGLEKYSKALYAAWRYRHRAALGEASLDWKQLAQREEVNLRFAQHIWAVLHNPSLGYPASEIAARWRKLPAPGADAKAAAATVRAQCGDIQKFIVTWPSWLFARGDVAAGGAGDESPLEISARTLKVDATRRFTFNTGLRFGRNATPAKGPAKVYISVTPVNPAPGSRPVVIWRNPTVSFRLPGPPQAPAAQTAAAGGVQTRRRPPSGPRQPLRAVVSPEVAARLGFGTSPDGAAIGPGDFASAGNVFFEAPLPDGVSGLEFQADAQVGLERNTVFRITFSEREDGAVRGIPVRALLGDPESAGYQRFKAGVLELAAILPPNSHSEPTPADKDPVPPPFDSTYNVPEHDEFDTRVKYVRDDRFVYEQMLDDAGRARLDQAWNDLYASFAYHDNYLDLLAKHYSFDLKGKRIGDLDQGAIDAMPAEMRPYVRPLRSQYLEAHSAQAAARATHVEDCLRLAARAWRRPLSATEKEGLRAFYQKALSSERDHPKAVRALLARILISPAFLYRVEQASAAALPKSLTGWELASRLSFLLWSSLPDDELRRAAAAGELTDPAQLRRQAQRMLADPKARRLATEFFGQWLGFYHFDRHNGVDTGRFPEFTGEVRGAMYDEAVSFFEHIVRKERPVREILFADYTFLNRVLAKHYGVPKPVQSTSAVELVEGANGFQRGGLLRLGAVLTATSAPLRTSPVKRGDWVLRRVLGTAVPPPPADAGSIPADDKLFGGLSVHEKLEAHKRNPTCANCHVRIDPLGFPLERYDSVGRWRDKYADGKAIFDAGVLADRTQVSGIDGLLAYMRTQEKQVLRTVSSKLLGYALGRTVQPSDEMLIERMAGAGGGAPFSRLVAEIVASRQFRNRAGGDDAVQLAANAASKGGR